MSVSHYTFEGDASERLMLKYYEYLLRTRRYSTTNAVSISSATLRSSQWTSIRH